MTTSSDLPPTSPPAHPLDTKQIHIILLECEQMFATWKQPDQLTEVIEVDDNAYINYSRCKPQ